MFDKTGGLDVIAMFHHEFAVLCRAHDLFAHFLGAHGAINQRHGNGLALVLTEHKTIAAGELRQLGFRSLEFVDRFAFGQFDIANINGKAEFFGFDFNRYGAIADFTNKGVAVGVSALGRISKRKNKPLVPAAQVL